MSNFDEEDGSEPRFVDVVQAICRGQIALLRTSTPGIVQAFNLAKGTVDVQPCIRDRYLNGDTEKLPQLVNVPIVYPQGGGFGLTFPLEKGDDVWLVFGERSLAEWKAQGNADIEAKVLTRFDLNHAVAYPGARPMNRVNSLLVANKIVLGEESPTGMKVSIGGGKITIGNSAAELLSLIDQLMTQVMTLASSVCTAPGAPISAGPAVAAAIPALKTSLALIKG